MKTKFFTLVTFLVAPLLCQGSVSLSFNGGVLYGSDTTSPLIDGRLIIAVTTANTSFSGPVVGSFVSGGDTLLGHWSADSGTGIEGGFDYTISSLELSGNIATGQKVAIYWFTDISSIGDLPQGGTAYGFYSDPAWLIPADGVLTTYSLEGEAIGGSVPNSATVANLTVSAVPEPATFAVFFGLAALGFCGRRKRRVA